MALKKIGFIGGGQLAYMAAPYGEKLGLELSALDAAHSPAAENFPNFVAGSIHSQEDVLDFGKSMDVITIEIENIAVEALFQLQETGKLVRPAAEIIALIQDKGLQKQFFEKHSLPTSPYRLLPKDPKVSEIIDFLPAYQKLRVGGYDGKGVKKVTPEIQSNELFQAPSVLEKAVNVRNEIAVIVARSASGNLVTYPPVEMIFNPSLNLIDFLYGPAEISSAVSDEATRIATTIAEKLNLVGLLAVELFIDKDGSLLVNELAPRAHNSGHHTIEAFDISQFEMHLRAIANLELPKPKLIARALMMNILGAADNFGPAQIEGQERLNKLENVYLHWYGKSETRPGRKMAHVTILGRSKIEAIALANDIRSWLRVTAK